MVVWFASVTLYLDDLHNSFVILTNELTTKTEKGVHRYISI